MKKLGIGIAAAVAVLLAGSAVTSYVMGGKVQEGFESTAKEWSKPPLMVQVQSYERGLFTSTAYTHAASQIPLPVPQARLAALVAVQREHDAAVADGDARRVFRSNQRFHREFFSLLDNAVLGQAIEEYARRDRRFGLVK